VLPSPEVMTAIPRIGLAVLQRKPHDTGVKHDISTLHVDPFSAEFLADPYSYHVQLREAGPVVRLERYGIWGMARYAQVVATLQDWTTFCSGRGGGLTDFAKEAPWRPPSIVLEADPPLHTRTRGVLTEVLSRPALARLRETMESHAEAKKRSGLRPFARYPATKRFPREYLILPGDAAG
jgi:cytochrome P450